MRGMTKVKLDLFSDVDMYLFFKKQMGGGASYISKRYIKANNKYAESYDLKELMKYITHLKKNNLYNYTVLKYLPMGRLKWLNTEKFSQDYDKFLRN